MIFITGDTHIPYDIGKLSTKRFSQQKLLAKNDYVIICGDFGGVWNNSSSDLYWLKWLHKKNFTTLFVDGNHENFYLLNSFPTEIWNGGKIHRINDSIFHLMRGQIFNINGLLFFTMGGATSHDKEFRIENKSWWKEEMPSNEEFNDAFHNLDKYNWKVDYVITHCAPTKIAQSISGIEDRDKLTDFLYVTSEKLSFNKHYFGHYHIDKEIDKKYFAIYNRIIQLPD